MAGLQSDIRGLAQTAVSGVIQAVASQKELASGMRVTFCSACFRCGWQLRKALLPNILFLLPWRACARICLVVFESEETDADIQWLWRYARPALECGLLIVAVTDLPGGWHACLAKNTSHKLAIQQHRRPLDLDGGATWLSLMLFNLDCDNILGPSFMDSLQTLLPVVPAHGCIHAVGRDPGTTGRVGLFATTFLRVGGYDESAMPMGYQDVDLLRRCQWLSTTKPCHMQPADVGLSVPNHLTDKKAARGIEKVRHVSSALAGMT